MIIVSGKPIDVNGLYNIYKSDSIEKKIIEKLFLSSKTYNYPSENYLKFELLVRINIISSSIELYKSNLSFKVFKYSTCNEKYWKRTDEGGFLLRQGEKPSNAIMDIYENSSSYGTECATAMVIVYYKALLDILPENLFNRLFPEIYLMNWQYIDGDFGDIGFLSNAHDYLPGDRRYFKNPDVSPLTPQWQGENVIDLGNGTFYGHGLGIRTSDEIIAALNKRRKEDAKTSAYLLDGAGIPDFEHLCDKYNDFLEHDDMQEQISTFSPFLNQNYSTV